MSYGHYARQFTSPDDARQYLAECRRDKNQSAENYHDRVAANRCILLAEGWAPVPLPAATSSKVRAAAPLKRKPSHSARRTSGST